MLHKWYLRNFFRNAFEFYPFVWVQILNLTLNIQPNRPKRSAQLGKQLIWTLNLSVIKIPLHKREIERESCVFSITVWRDDVICKKGNKKSKHQDDTMHRRACHVRTKLGLLLSPVSTWVYYPPVCAVHELEHCGPVEKLFGPTVYVLYIFN
jgi:hypothetical protein